jgi:hypothetical protein
MNIKAIILVTLTITLLSACVVRPAHRGVKGGIKVPIKYVLSLDHEHQGHDIVIVNAQPTKKRNCRSHKKHWHCNR